MVNYSSFHGRIKEIPFIAIDDFFFDMNKPAYFLSHYHSDHIQGLANENWHKALRHNNVFIYTSKITAEIIKQKFHLLKDNVKALELGHNVITINNGLFRGQKNEEILSVTLLPAGHSFGSVMFLFEYEGKNILFTGDFRISRNSVSKYAHLHSNGEPIRIDVMYVDTTFQNAPYFPKRQDTVRNAVIHIKNWLDQSDDHKVRLVTSAGFGYEYVCNEVFRETGIKTYVDEDFYCIYSQFPKEVFGVTNDRRSRVYMMTKYTQEYKYSEYDPLTLDVYFSAMKWANEINVHEEFLNIGTNKIEVCFATHCDGSELRYFVNYFKPAKVEGFSIHYKDNNYDVLLEGFPNPTVDEENFKITPKKKKVVREKNEVGKKVSKKILEEAFDW